MTRYAVGLGSNLGDRVGHLRSAIESMGRLGRMDGISGLYETEPIGGPEQDPYLNAVAVLDSTLSARQLLDELRAIEADHDRTREVRWGARTLDLDIVSRDGEPVETPDLVIPHPRAAKRRFVLEPLAAVWPEALVRDGLTAAEARDAVTDQDVDLLATRWVDEGQKQGRYWVGAQLLLFLAIGIALVTDGLLGPTGGDLLIIDDPSVDGWRIVGGVLVIVGGLGMVASARSLGRALSVLPEPIAGADLVETGLYAYARHPIYGAICLALLGASLFFASTAATVLSFGLPVFFWAKSSYEERQLRIAYPGYRAYRQRVRHRLIPYLL